MDSKSGSPKADSVLLAFAILLAWAVGLGPIDIHVESATGGLIHR